MTGNNLNLSVVINTYNEELHIERCIKSILPFARDVFVVDSFSTDKTVEICESLGAKVYQNPWKNYADQFQWGLDNCPIRTDWIMRMDADEYIEPDLIKEISFHLPVVSPETSGIYIRRKYFFLGKWIRRGATYPLNLLRIWRAGRGRIENRWMDEHIVLEYDAKTVQFRGHIVDDNLNNTRWWIDKHNKYADREMIEILNLKYELFNRDDSLLAEAKFSQAKIIRFVKEKIYNLLPIFLRPLIYFLYRYFIRLGFLDGTRGFAFHFMQGYWYRCLVDLRVYEAERVLINAADNKQRIKLLSEITGLDL